jgi:hypothetical protein
VGPDAGAASVVHDGDDDDVAGLVSTSTYRCASTISARRIGGR